MTDIATWIAPIAGDLPGGRDARHEPEHERIRAELDKLGGVHGKPVDWCAIRSDAEALLQSKSKDLLIAAYLAFAWARLDGLSGLTRGMELLASLLARFPDALQPQRPRARANALSWFSERAAELPLSEGCSHADAERLRAAHGALLAAARQALGAECPPLSELGRSVERAALSAAPLSAAAEPGAAASDAPPSVADSSPAPEAARADQWLAPIPGPARAGGDASQDDEYFAVQAEIEKLQSLQGARPDWVRVHALSSKLLAERSKDFALAGYLTLALAETAGLAGLARGLAALAGLLEGYWEDALPPLGRLKRRANVLGFVFERLALALPRISAHKPADPAALDAALAALAEQLSARFGAAEAPSLAPLLEAWAKLPDARGAGSGIVAGAAAAASAPDGGAGALHAGVEAGSHAGAAAADSAAEVASAGGAAAAGRTNGATSAGAPGGELALPAAAPAPSDVAALAPFLTASGAALVEAARALLEADPRDAGSYRLLRVGLWLELAALPPAQGDGRTRMRPPERRVREALASLVAGARWEAALLQSEATLRANPLWLDACWISARALEALGEPYAPAKHALACESRALLARLPQLLELRFMDGTPLASPEAVAWFRAGSADQITPSEAGPSKAFQAALEAALGSGDAAAGRELEVLLRAAPSAREAFRLRLSLARSVENSGKLEAAAALYLGLERDVDTHRLEDWEPELAREVFGALWALARRKAALLTASDAQRICARLARLAPLALT